MFNIFKKFKTEKKSNQSVSTGSYGQVDEQKMLKESTAHYKEGNVDKAIECIDIAIDSYEKSNDTINVLPAYKKKGSYLYKNGKKDKSWRLYNQLLSVYSNDHIALPQVYDEMRKQLEFEKKYVDALDKAIYSSILRTKSHLIQNNHYQDDAFTIDEKWENDAQFTKLAKKAEIDWEKVKSVLVEEYKNINHKSDFNAIYFKVREILKAD